MNQTILVADDETNITDVCRRYLEREGYKVLVANDGVQALELWKAHQPHFIILDSMMPGKNGWQVCDEIRAQQEVPIIMLTARGDEPDRLLGLIMGVASAKAITAETLYFEGDTTTVTVHMASWWSRRSGKRQRTRQPFLVHITEGPFGEGLTQ